MSRICFFSGDITRNGGTERVSVMIANELVKDPGYEILILSLVEQKEKPFYEIDDRIKRFALGNRWLTPGPEYLPLIPKLRSFLKQREIDIIIDIDIVLDVLSFPASRGRKTKVISWEHSNLGFELSQGYRRWILKLFTKRTDWIVTLTPGDAKAFCTEMNRQERISAIFNPIERLGQRSDGGDNSSGGEPVRALASFDERENAIVTVARLVPVKGFDLLVRVAEKVLTAYPDWKWYLCGEGPERTMLEEFCKGSGLQEQLILCGMVPRVEDYLCRAKLFVLTSRSEGLPMCLLEARSMGVPCVSFDIPTGPADMIEDGVNGYLIDAFDVEKMAGKIKSLISDPARLAEMGKKASEQLEPFGMERVIGQWKKLLGGLLEK